MRKAHGRAGELELADLVDGNWIQFPLNEAPGVMVEQAFGARGLAAPSAIVRTSSFSLRYTLLTMGDYLTVIPACMLRVFNAKVPAVKALSVNLGTQPRPVAIFTLKNRTLSPVAILVINAFASWRKGWRFGHDNTVRYLTADESKPQS